MDLQNIAQYFLGNTLGNKRYGTWNVLPSVLTMLAGTLAATSSKTQYALYQEQARQFVETAKENAKLIKSKGEIELRNLRYQNRLDRGSDLATMGAKGGNLSGSNLDVIMQKEKIRKMDEQTVKANYTNQAMLELVSGYTKAMSTYGSIAAKANADKYAIWGSLAKGIGTYFKLQANDATMQNRADIQMSLESSRFDTYAKFIEDRYRKKSPDYLGEPMRSEHEDFDSSVLGGLAYNDEIRFSS